MQIGGILLGKIGQAERLLSTAWVGYVDVPDVDGAGVVSPDP